MKRKQERRGTRRLVAMTAAAATLWGVVLTADPAAAIDSVKALGRSPGVVTRLLEAELGRVEEADGFFSDLSQWERLVVSQSALLAQGEAGVDAYLQAARPSEGEESPAAQPEEAPPQEESGEEEPPAAVERTLTAAGGANCVTAADIAINNATGKTVDIAALLAALVELNVGAGPQILIMHTHGSEAYAPEGADQYEPTDTARTNDDNYNVVRIGEEMAQVFESLGLEVVHDTSLYDYPSYSGSYARSLAGVQSYLERYPTIALVLDVHRDALIADDGTTYKAVTTVNGEKTAQVMLVIGTDDGGLSHPNWQKNLTLGVHLQQALAAVDPTLARPINLRSSRFNQQLTPGSLLVEVGTSGNTLAEAIRGGRLFAQAAGEYLLTLKTE